MTDNGDQVFKHVLPQRTSFTIDVMDTPDGLKAIRLHMLTGMVVLIVPAEELTQMGELLKAEGERKPSGLVVPTLDMSKVIPANREQRRHPGGQG